MHCHDFRRATDWRHFDFEFSFRLVSNVSDVGSTHDPAPSTVKMKDMRDQHVIFGISTKKTLNKMTTTTNNQQPTDNSVDNERMLHARSNVLWYQTSYGSTYISLCEKVAHKGIAQGVHIVEPMPVERPRRTCCHRTDQQPTTGSQVPASCSCLLAPIPCLSQPLAVRANSDSSRMLYAGAASFYSERTLQPWHSGQPASQPVRQSDDLPTSTPLPSSLWLCGAVARCPGGRLPPLDTCRLVKCWVLNKFPANCCAHN